MDHYVANQCNLPSGYPAAIGGPIGGPLGPLGPLGPWALGPLGPQGPMGPSFPRFAGKSIFKKSTSLRVGAPQALFSEKVDNLRKHIDF